MSNGWGGPQYPGWDYFAGMPGMQTALSGGFGSTMGNYDPRMYTGALQGDLTKMMYGSQDMALTSPTKYAGLMGQQQKIAAKGAKGKALSQLKATEGAGFDPGAAAYLGGLFDVMPAQQAPANYLASAQMASAENAPKISANTAMRTGAMSGATGLAASNQQAALSFMTQKAALQQSALNTAMSAMANLYGSQLGFMQGMMPQYSAKTPYGGQYSGRYFAGSDPLAWMLYGNYSPVSQPQQGFSGY